MFVAALFVITKDWKQSRCPLPGEWLNSLGHIYTTGCYSAIKKGWTLDTGDNPDASPVEDAKWKKAISQRSHTYGCNDKIIELETPLLVARG